MVRNIVLFMFICVIDIVSCQEYLLRHGAGIDSALPLDEVAQMDVGGMKVVPEPMSRELRATENMDLQFGMEVRLAEEQLAFAEQEPLKRIQLERVLVQSKKEKEERKHAKKLAVPAVPLRRSVSKVAPVQAMPATRAIVLHPFAAKNFVEPGEKSNGRAFIEFSKEEFVDRVNAWYEERVAEGVDPLREGYAPFCQHLFLPNFVPGLRDSVPALTDDVAGLVRSEYVARTEKELPVLTRWVSKSSVGDAAPEAKFLDVILYSREQIRKVNEAQGETNDADEPWGIVSVKPQGVDSEIPMEPITMMRNALGTEHGGSGVTLDATLYRQSVDFWNKHVRLT